MREQLPGPGGDRLGDGGLVAEPGPALFGTRACLAFGAGGPVQGVGAPGQALDPLLVGTGLEAGLHLRLPGVGAVGGEPVAHGGVGLFLDRHLLGDGQPLGQFLDLHERLVQRLLGPRRRGGGPFRLTGGAPCLPGEPAELLGDGRLLPVGGPAPLPSSSTSAAHSRRRSTAASCSRASSSHRTPSSASSAAAWSTDACTSSRLGAPADPPCAKCAPSRSPSAVTAVSSGWV